MDGPKAQHDAARRLRNGAGSFDQVAPLARAFAAEARRAGQDVRGRATLHRGHLGAVDALYPCERFIGHADYRLGSVLGAAYAADRVRQLSEQDRICAFEKCRDCCAMLYCKEHLRRGAAAVPAGNRPAGARLRHLSADPPPDPAGLRAPAPESADPASRCRRVRARRYDLIPRRRRRYRTPVCCTSLAVYGRCIDWYTVRETVPGACDDHRHP
jgi:radical SAM protein with 4Fe4S-binding SPASM domain